MKQQTAQFKVLDQKSGVKYGCFLELDADQAPDGCVHDYNGLDDCLQARRHKTREGCKYWLPVTTDRSKVE